MVYTEQKLREDIEAACPGIPARVVSPALSAQEAAQSALLAGEGEPVIFVSPERTHANAGQLQGCACGNGAMSFALLLTPGELFASPYIMAVAASSCAMAISRLTPRKPCIVWPGGIIIEIGQVATVRDWSVDANGQRANIVSVCANIHTEGGQSGVCDKYASLDAPYLSPGRLAGEIAREILAIARNPDNVDYMDFYRERSTVLEKNISYIYEGRRRTARVMGVDDSGALVVLHEDGTPDRLNDTSLEYTLY